MNKSKTKKFNIMLYLIVLVAVFAMFITTSYSYYKKVIKEKDNSNLDIKYVNMLTTFYNPNQINGYNIKPGWEKVIDFTIENSSEDTIGNYKISFEIITPLSNMTDEDFVYTITGSSESKDTSNVVINKIDTPIPVLNRDIGTGSITPKNTHTYTITLKLKDDADIKKYSSKNYLFAGKIKVNNDTTR